MAGDSEEIKKIKKQLEDLKGSFGKDLQDSIDQIIKRLSSGSSTLNEWKTQLTLFQTQADEVSDSLDYVSKSLSDSVNELKKGDEFLRKQVNSTRKLSSIADQLLSIRKGEASFDKKKINNLKDQSKLHIQNLQSLLSQQKEGSSMAKALQRDIDAAMGLNEGFDGIEETASNINKKLGILPQAAKGIDKAFGKLGLGNLGIADAIDETHRLGQEAARVGDRGFKSMSTFVGNLTDKLGESLTKVNLIQFALVQVADALIATDTGAGDLAKSFNMTYSEALDTRRELGNMAAISGDVALTTKGLQETLVAVGNQLGTNAKLNDDDLKTFTKLREQAGYTNEELMGIQQISLVNGKSLEKNTSEILGGAKAYASRNKLIINEKQILRDVSKMSASLKLTLGGSAEKMAEAAVKARQFGLNLEQAEKMSSSLLDFESSIESELSAELLTGKDLNFERARGLALNGDTAAAAEEIAKQVGTSADFAKMNVIQQEALAKAAGLTKDELAQSLMDKEALAKLSGVEGANAQEKFNNLVKQVGMEEAKKRLGDEQLAAQYEQQSVQERFAQATEKLKEIFIQIAEPILAILSPLMNLVGTVLPLINTLLQPIVWVFQTIADAVKGFTDLLNGELHEGLGGFLQIAQSIATVWAGIVLTSKILGKETIKNISLQGIFSNLLKKDFWLSIGSSIAKMWGAIVGMLGPFGIPVAIAAGAGLVGLASSFLSKGDDVMSPGESGGGYGKRTLFGPEGAIQLNNKDTVIAGTNLFDGASKGDDVMSSPKGAISVSNSTAPKKEVKQDPSAGTNARLDALISATGKVNSISTLKIQ